MRGIRSRGSRPTRKSLESGRFAAAAVALHIAPLRFRLRVALGAAAADRLDGDLDPEENEPDRRADDDDGERSEERHLLERVLRHPRPDQPDRDDDHSHRENESAVHGAEGTLAT